MDKMLRDTLLYATAYAFFVEAIDYKVVATFYAIDNDWSSHDKVTIDGFAELILSRLDEDKLYREGVVFTDEDIEFFKNNSIPKALRRALEKYNDTVETKIENGKFWFRAR